MPMWMKMSFQNSNSPLMEHLSFFHDHSMMILVSTTIITSYILVSNFNSNSFNRFFLEFQELELFWTSIPALMLMFISIPSLKTLYLMEENMKPSLLIKTMGYQWNWSYEYPNFSNDKFLSSIIKDKMINLLNTSNHLWIPIKTPTQMLISSKDVLHSWTIPSLGMKADATPGRLNQITLLVNKPSYLVGQCSEICGAGHSFMPITMESTSLKYMPKM